MVLLVVEFLPHNFFSKVEALSFPTFCLFSFCSSSSYSRSFLSKNLFIAAAIKCFRFISCFLTVDTEAILTTSGSCFFSSKSNDSKRSWILYRAVNLLESDFITGSNSITGFSRVMLVSVICWSSSELSDYSSLVLSG